jgi:hypothetical protein
MDAVNAIEGVVGGSTMKMAGTFNVQVAAMSANWEKLTADFGKTDLDPLTQIATFINKIITGIDDWAQKNPELAKSVETIVLVLAGFLTIATAVLGMMTALSIIVLALGGPFTILALIIVAVGALVAVAVALIVQHWTELKQLVEALWTAFMHNLENAFTNTKIVLLLILDEIGKYWNVTWQGIQTFFLGIWDGIKTGLTTALDFLKGTLNAFVSWATGVFAPVLAAVNAISGAASVVGKGVSSAVSSVGHAIGVNDAIITPGGQVIQTNPSDYLIATKTPGALGGG